MFSIHRPGERHGRVRSGDRWPRLRRRPGTAVFLVALLGGWLVAGCGSVAGAQSATPPVEVTASPTPDPADPIHPLLRRQATVQAQLAPELRDAALAAAATVASRDEAAAAAAAAAAAEEQARRELVQRALDVIRVADTGPLQEVAAVMDARKVPVEFGPLPRGVLGQWDTRRQTITIAQDFRQEPAEPLAGVLVHEATHAYDYYRGRRGTTRADCYDLEGRAFSNQARLWEALYGKNGKVGTNDPLEKELNQILQSVNEHPTTFAVDLLLLYHVQCT